MLKPCIVIWTYTCFTGESYIALNLQLESLDLDASAKSELSVSRSSSLIANLSGYDEEDTDSHDMNITVDDPEKHSGTMESYVTFRITLRVMIQFPFCSHDITDNTFITYSESESVFKCHYFTET